jgi:hypothetical protein
MFYHRSWRYSSEALGSTLSTKKILFYYKNIVKENRKIEKQRGKSSIICNSHTNTAKIEVRWNIDPSNYILCWHVEKVSTRTNSVEEVYRPPSCNIISQKFLG